ncbi:hypothetical protein C8N46_11441 [Kordia periserrulae]|uniref:Uncharacterized protein n=1 Tax=Kordia periserrulae TaxID=701523 RepID=A0A2T6BQS6_9FLAO|nr:hypothetical protein [Kordia periserrulae]PTX58396.1 hypothetical protein C8N46_11441 [Kordia periserrulae]
MCKEDLKIHFCTCSNKLEINIDFADEVVKLYQLKKNDSRMAILNDDGSYMETYFKWTLSSFKEEVNKNGVMGMMVYPKTQINNELTIDSILEALNSNSNPFDFNYKPKEKDFIKIEEKYKFIEIDDHKRPAIMEYISFKFENGKWEFGRYPMHFIHQETEIGKIKTLNNK